MASVNLPQSADRASAQCDRVRWRVINRFTQAQGAPTLKRVHFELGGKNPVIVFDDADLERALDVAFMIWLLNGECCTSSSRVLIQSSIHDEFVAKLKSVSPLFRRSSSTRQR